MRQDTLRQRIVSSPALNRAAAGLFRLWLELVYRSSRREADGWEAVARLIETHGAVIIVCWHQRIMLTPWMFDLAQAPCRSLTSAGRAGRLVGWMHRAFGYGTVPMPKGHWGAAQMRDVLRGLKEGVSIGISPDGPRGPARVAKVTPIQWARTAQVPVVVFTFSTSRAWHWRTWDRLMFPLPFGRIAMLWRVWDRAVPPRFSEEEGEALAAELGAFMDAVTAQADARVGR
ncbi:MAG: lysophospholipid acyltransferase family protein [Roseicyclus sp.]|uniref:lysophospholipid acyltransferase family protein n=1 Tax=Roseicyclus sp. TaxID=1914329 RepID=UPI003A85323E